MRRRSTLKACLRQLQIVGAISCLTFVGSCTDYLSGQDPEPPGPLLVTRMTLSDPSGDTTAGEPVFSDTSAPLNCAADAVKDTPGCVNDPFKDMYSLSKSPPTPDSATKLRVIFNKIPLKAGGFDIEHVPDEGLAQKGKDLRLIDSSIIQLSCDGESCGVPASYNSLQATGTGLSPDPTTFDYGPALQMEVLPAYDSEQVGTDSTGSVLIPDDPVRALEPNTVYHVVLNPTLSGRNPQDVLRLDAPTKVLLTFATQPFTPIRIGIGDQKTKATEAGDSASDRFLSDKCIRGSGTGNDPFIAAAADDDCNYVEMANDGVFAVYMNAPVDEQSLQADTARATLKITGTPAEPSAPIDVVLQNGVGDVQKPESGCNRGNKRVLYIAPAHGLWALGLGADQVAVVTVALRGSDIRDVSQRAGHPPGTGRNTISGDMVLRASIKPQNSRLDGQSAANVLVCATAPTVLARPRRL